LTLLAALGWLACDFTSREPEPPDQDEGRLVSLTDPDSTIFQIQLGVSNGLITDYMNAFTDEFIFIPDAADASPVFENWNFDVERNTMQVIFSRFSSRSVSFVTGDSSATIPGEEVEINEHYDLLLNTGLYQGTARLRMRRDAGGSWRIFQWEDFRRQGSQFPTWGRVRGENRSG
jgi:hypothetical protein